MVTAVNPVIRGFAPDPSIVCVDDWYYVATSSFEWFPTIPLYRSRDLADWEYAGAVDSAAPGASLLGVPDSGGIWAPSLSFAHGTFWVVYSIVRSVGRRYFDLETYVCVSKDAAGPWSAPIRVPGHGFDPSLLHHEGHLYLLNLQNDSRLGGRRFDGIVMTELNPEWDADGELRSLHPAAPTRLLLQRDELIEGPKITVKDGWFYLLLAQGGTGVEHGVLVARSRRLEGPYEVDDVPLLTTRDDSSVSLQKAGHGELVQTPCGRWFMTHLASRSLQTSSGPRSPLGRETAIQEIVWRDGWPRLRQGGWHPIEQVDVPAVKLDAVIAEIGTGLDAAPAWPWSTLRMPAGDWCDASRPGRLRLRGQHGAESLWEQSLIAQRLTEHTAHAEVTVDAHPETFTQSAGIVLWYATDAFVQLHVTWAEPAQEPQAGQQWVGRGRRILRLEQRLPDGAKVIAETDAPAGPIRLGLTTNGLTARFWAGPAHAQPTPIGGTVDVSMLSDEGGGLRFTGTFIGISATDLVGEEFWAEFSDWSLRFDGTSQQ